MLSLPSESRINLSLLLFGLLIKCPFERELGSCPLLSLRAMGCLEEKYALAAQFSEDEVHQFLAWHQACYRTRLAEALNRARDGVAQQTSAAQLGSGVQHGGAQQFSARC